MKLKIKVDVVDVYYFCNSNARNYKRGKLLCASESNLIVWADIECLDVMDAGQTKLFYMLSNHKKGNLVLTQAIFITHGKITVNLI